MRNKERIPIILKKLKNRANIDKILHYWFQLKPGTQMEIGMPFYDISLIGDNIEKKLLKIEETWKEFPDARLAQVLIIAKVLDQYPGNYFYIEDEETMIESGIMEAKDILFWGQAFDKDGSRLPITIYKKIKDLETSHIENIIKDYKEGKYKIKAYFYEHLLKELKSRNYE